MGAHDFKNQIKGVWYELRIPVKSSGVFITWYIYLSKLEFGSSGVSIILIVIARQTFENCDALEQDSRIFGQNSEYRRWRLLPF